MVLAACEDAGGPARDARPPLIGDAGAHSTADGGLEQDSGLGQDSGLKQDGGLEQDSGAQSAAHTIGGQVLGLVGSGLVLQNNGADDLALSTSGTFVFAKPLAVGETFDISVKQQPTGPRQTCSLSGAQGTVQAADVTSVEVSCVTYAFKLGGTLTGLAQGNTLILTNSGVDELSLSESGPFVFARALVPGEDYEVEATAPSGPVRQRCTVSHESGKMADQDVSSVQVDCIDVFTLGGTITGLTGDGLVLATYEGDRLVVPKDATSFTFGSPLEAGTYFFISATAHPPGLSCLVEEHRGWVWGDGDITHVRVVCAPHAQYCQTVEGIRWCRDPEPERSCNALCSALGFGNPTLTDAAWLAAQDTQEECAAIAAAFGIDRVRPLDTYGLGCASEKAGELTCSTSEECPTYKRTLASVSSHAVCPCQ